MTFLALWAQLAVGPTDNFAKPLVAKGHTPLPASLLSIAMVCGLVVFDRMGLVAGPLDAGARGSTAERAKRTGVSSRFETSIAERRPQGRVGRLAVQACDR